MGYEGTCVMSSTIHDFGEEVRNPVISVMNGDGPKVYKEEEAKVDPFVDRKEIDVDVVGEALQEAINRMKCC